MQRPTSPCSSTMPTCGSFPQGGDPTGQSVLRRTEPLPDRRRPRKRRSRVCSMPNFAGQSLDPVDDLRRALPARQHRSSRRVSSCTIPRRSPQHRSCRDEAAARTARQARAAVPNLRQVASHAGYQRRLQRADARRRAHRRGLAARRRHRHHEHHARVGRRTNARDRRAQGDRCAPRSQVLLQFFIEALVLCGAGARSAGRSASGSARWSTSRDRQGHRNGRRAPVAAQTIAIAAAFAVS